MIIPLGADMSKYKVALDAGHGGSDPGAVYNDRQEKDDTLDLTLAVGDILKKNGVDVFYTRTNDEYETPFKKATDANNSGADLFVSIHRNSSEKPNQYSGVETLVYNDSGFKSEVARNINNQLENVGFKNLGVDTRKNLVVLKRTKMPAVLVEAGFINNEKDNYIFDQEFDKVANAIADGILESIPASARNNNNSHSNNNNNNNNKNDNTSNNNRNDNISNNNRNDNNRNDNINNNNNNNNNRNDYNNSNNSNKNSLSPANTTDSMAVTSYISNGADCGCNYDDNTDNSYSPQPLYRVQTGAYRNKENADRMLNSLLIDGFPAFIIYEDGYYKVQVGAYAHLANAIKMEQRLRRFHYNTYITT